MNQLLKPAITNSTSYQNSTQFYGFFSWFIPILQGAAVTVEAQNIFNAVQDREGEADALRMQAKTQTKREPWGGCLFFME